MFSHSEKNEGLRHVTTWTDTENNPSDISHPESPPRLEPSVLLKSIRVVQIRESLGSSCRRRKPDPNGVGYFTQWGRWQQFKWTCGLGYNMETTMISSFRAMWWFRGRVSLFGDKTHWSIPCEVANVVKKRQLGSLSVEIQGICAAVTGSLHLEITTESSTLTNNHVSTRSQEQRPHQASWWRPSPPDPIHPPRRGHSPV